MNILALKKLGGMSCRLCNLGKEHPDGYDQCCYESNDSSRR